MSANLARSIANKCILSVRNFGISQQRLGSYKAAVIKETGKPLEIEEMKIKKLEKEEIRVQVNYCSVNTFDVQMFKEAKTNVKLPTVPGYEMSGEVLEVGEDILPVIATVGDRVAVLSSNKGGFAEQCVVHKNDIWRLPSKVKLKNAAVMIDGHTNALYAFSRLTILNEKSTVVISAGPAGLGLAAIDVAANVFKTKPYGVCDTEERGTLVRERGAFKTASFNSKNLRKDLGLKKGADVIYDGVGGDVHKILNTCIHNQGHVFYAAPFYCPIIYSPSYNSYLTVVNIQDLRFTDVNLYRQLVQDTIDLADQGLISAHVSATYKLDKINDAIKFIEEKKCTGKVVIDNSKED